MERPVVFPWFPFLLFMWLSAASAQNEPVYTAVNGIINLKPDSSGPFTNILWKHKGNLVAEWVDDVLKYYGMFAGRTTLDTTTGGLVITNTDDSFTGLYTVETNSQVQAKGYDVKFIKEVTKPEGDAVYVKLGGTISLKPESSGPFTNIVWKHQGNLVVEWWNNDLDYYGMFVGRTTLDTTTGLLEIKDTNEHFAGLYTVELNNQPQSKGYDVKFIKEVTKPKVGVKPLACSLEQVTSTLVCFHNETSGVGPLTYSWRADGGDWKQGDKEMPIVNDEKTQGVETFSCRVQNPVSETESDPRMNPFYIDKLI